MLLHLTPRFYLSYSDVQVDIIDLFIPELGLNLKGGKDVVIRTPYPNKRYKVACRKKGQKAINGIFIETDSQLENLTVISRWAVNGEVSTHTIHYHIMDSEYDAVTDYITLWSAHHGTEFGSRLNEVNSQWVPAKDQPRMIVLSKDNESARDDSIYNVMDKDGIIRERFEYFEIPTVERNRLAVPFWGHDRLPIIEDKFSANNSHYSMTLTPGDFSQFGVCVVPLSDWIREVEGDYLSDISFMMILKEIGEKCHFFYSNTNDLINKVRLFSPTYAELNDEEKSGIDSQLKQPIFHVFINEDTKAD